MKKYIIYASIVVMFATFMSCQKFLDIKPESSNTSSNFYKTQADFNAAVLACYSSLRSYPSTEVFPLSEYRSDNIFIKSFTSGAQDQYMINKFTEVSANSLLSDAWTDMYSGIYNCNMVISKITDATVNNQLTQTLKSQYEGEARFIRALYYFSLVRMFGGVPIVNQPISTTESLMIARASSDTTYQFIENDLDSAINLLPETYSSTDLGRVRRSAAQGLLAKVLLTEKKYSLAQSLLQTIIASTNYSLLPSIADSLNGVFSVNNEMNNEILFAIRYAKSITGGGHSAWLSPGSSIANAGINVSLTTAYASTDNRKKLIGFTKVGNVFYSNKYFDTPDILNKTFDNDFIVLRYSDILLMYAECLNETQALSNSATDSTQALYWLNRVRTRSYTTGAYSVANIQSQANMRSLILNERWLEFPLEGQRWFDITRTGTASQYILQNSGSSSPNATITPQAIITAVESYRYIYPIPNAEIQKINNSNILYQNPGYN